MINKRELKNEIERLTNLQMIVEAFEEIGIAKMRRIRDRVLQSRYFLEDINKVFQNIKSSRTYELSQMAKQTHVDINKLQFRKTNGKAVFVYLSANAPLYGTIVRKTFGFFIENIKRRKGDIVIVGKIGLGYFLEENLALEYTYFDLSDDKLNLDQLKKLVNFLLQYEKIYVFHGRFQSLVTQDAYMTSVSGDVFEQGKNTVHPLKYIFEPSVAKVMSFFETEILASAFEQTIQESQLAKHASRMVSLDAAAGTIRQSIKKVKFEEDRLRHRIMNQKQLNVLTSLSLWNT